MQRSKNTITEKVTKKSVNVIQAKPKASISKASTEHITSTSKNYSLGDKLI